MKTPQGKRVMYFLAVYAAEEGGYWTRFVDFPAADQGETLEEALANAADFLQDIVDKYAKVMKKPLPAPLSIEEFTARLDPADGKPVCVVPIFAWPPAPAVRIQITAKANQIAEIDTYARAHDLTRSEVLIQSALTAIRS